MRTAVLRWLAGATTLLYVLSRFLPCSPPVQHGEIEDSYMQVLHTAFAAHWQFGRDIVFPFGPWGLLYGGYLPATHLVCVIAWAVLSAVFWWAAWRLTRQFFSDYLPAWLFVMGLAAVAGLEVLTVPDARLK